MTSPLLINSTAKNGGYSWAQSHDRAVRNPKTDGEVAIVGLAAAIHNAAAWIDGPDAVGTPAVGALIEGFRTLLNYDLGRLDAGTCEGFAWKAARRVGWDLDREEVVWS